MKKTTALSNLALVDKDSYVCSEEEFNINTDKEDGCNLEVVNLETNKVTGYYLAYAGKWNKR